MKVNYPTCPNCGARMIIYTDYVACEKLACGGLLDPSWLGLPPVAKLRRQYPSLVSTLAADGKR